MARPRKPASDLSIAPSKTSHLFGSRKPGERAAAVTSESISADLEAFHKTGGEIEVLGITRTLNRIGVPADQAPAATPANTLAKRKQGER